MLNGPNINPLESTAIEGNTITGKIFHPLICIADEINIAFTTIPTNHWG